MEKNVQVLEYDSNQSEAWNDFVARESAFSLLQSWEWGEFKKELGWKVYRIAVEEDGQIICCAQLLVKIIPPGLTSIAYIPRGPLGRWLEEKPRQLLFSEVHRIVRSHRAIFLKIEPLQVNDPEIEKILVQEGFRPNINTNQPRATIILNLDQPDDVLLKGMRASTRSSIRTAAQKGVAVRMGGESDLPEFYRMMQYTSRRKGFSARSFEYYKQEWLTFNKNNQAALLLAAHQDTLLYAHVVYRFGKHAASFHTGSSGEMPTLRSNILLMWESLRWAKSQGCTTFDFWGIPNEIGAAVDAGQEPPVTDRTDGLWGVYTFKSGFSKKVVYYLGAFDYVYRPAIYAVIANQFLSSEVAERISGWLDLIGKRREKHQAGK